MRTHALPDRKLKAVNVSPCCLLSVGYYGIGVVMRPHEQSGVAKTLRRFTVVVPKNFADRLVIRIVDLNN